jgi:hypothetical protein
MSQEVNEYLAGVASAQVCLFGILLEQIDREWGGQVKQGFAEELRRIVAMSAASPDKQHPGQTMIFNSLLRWLSPPANPGWTPVVIEGSARGRQAQAASESGI